MTDRNPKAATVTVEPSYRPGQLYKGRDKDLLFAVITDQGQIAFVTNCGTPVSMARAEQVYAPLTLVRPVGSEAAAPLSDDLRALVEGIREVLVAPIPANWGRDQAAYRRLQRDRAVAVDGYLGLLLEDTSGPVMTARLIRKVAIHKPVTYATDETDGTA